uniref:Uncharacterized protein n=1 Tax=Romanomermis culicivorax TaxID=13658 RepID=A0A915KIQ4_ROMCU
MTIGDVQMHTDLYRGSEVKLDIVLDHKPEGQVMMITNGAQHLGRSNEITDGVQHLARSESYADISTGVQHPFRSGQ